VRPDALTPALSHSAMEKKKNKLLSGKSFCFFLDIYSFTYLLKIINVSYKQIPAHQTLGLISFCRLWV
ncbi:hypothetical protein ACVGXO_03555, partial [Enterobacter hormaechei]